MTHLVVLLLMSLTVAAVQPPATGTGTEMVARWASYARGERWVSILLRSDLERSPEWAESEETPPLSPRRAVDVARAQLVKVMPHDYKRALAELAAAETHAGAAA